MRLVERGLRSRAFLIQFGQIMGEFGEEIPWLHPLKGIEYATNASWFRDRFLRTLQCSDDSLVTPFQFVASDASCEYFGGMMHFAQSPERFRSKENVEVSEFLVDSGFHYISCLQVRDVRRGFGYGCDLMRRAIRTIKHRYGCVWGVVSSQWILDWHLSLDLGARAYSSPSTNREGLGILSWS